MSSDSLIHALAGATGGMVAMSATYPLIFLSTRAAVETSKERKTTRQAIKDIINREGISGLYSGLTSSLLGIAVTNGVYYFFYERSRALVLKSRGGSRGLNALESILIGLIAGSATAAISNPLWVIQTSQSVQTMQLSSESEPGNKPVSKKLGFLETIQRILKKGGIKAFWRGLIPALILVINPVLQYTVFEQLKNMLVTSRTTKLRLAGAKDAAAVLTDGDYFLLGALSKLVSTSLTYPIIVVKSRLQAGRENPHKNKSALSTILAIANEEGIEALFNGVGNKLLQSVLTAAILFASQRRIYEVTKKTLTTVKV